MPTKLSQLPAADPATAAAGVVLWTGKDAISGLELEYTVANGLRVKPGCAVIESLGYLVNVATAITKTGLTLAANTMYHVYLYMNSGSPDIEIVTNAPASPYFGTARSKTSDTSRRYLGSVLTTAANTIAQFIQSGNDVVYPAAGTGALPFRVLAAKTSAAEESVALSGVIPLTATGVFARFFFNRTVGDNAMNFGPTAGLPKLSNVTSPGAVFFTVPVTSSLLLYIQLNNTISDGNGAAYIDVNGYTYAR